MNDFSDFKKIPNIPYIINENGDTFHWKRLYRINSFKVRNKTLIRLNRKVIDIQYLILAAFHGYRNNIIGFLHKDGDHNNITLSNLEWLIENGEILYGNIKNYPLYHVTKDGNVFSSRTAMSKHIFQTWKKLKLNVNDSGHLFVYLSNGIEGFNQLVHRLVLKTFVSDPPNGLVCCHNDGNPSNNNVENLRWDTPQNNVLDAIKHKAFPSGESHKKSKFSNETIINIFVDYYNKISIGDIVKKFNISKSQVYKILSRTSWRHVKIEDYLIPQKPITYVKKTFENN